jgi:GDSL-like Lipase/Acylhydrolase family
MIEKSAEPISKLSHVEAAQGRWKTMRVEIAVVAVCVIAAVIASVTAYDVAGFVVMARPATKLANPPKVSKLIVLLAMLVGAGSAFLAAAWQTWKPNSIHRQVASSWSLTFTVFWMLLGLYVFFIYYPLPYHSHHIDKLLLYGALVLAWALLFAFCPDKLAVWLSGRVYEWIKVGLVNVLVFVVLGEVTLRVIDPFLARSGLFGDKQTPANLKPHTKVWGTIGFSNSQGFRDRERAVQRTSPAPRIVALGDSFTYGAGVSYDQTFVTQLEQGMQREFPGAEVINLGVPGWETPEEVHLLKIYGIKFQPDLVILNFFIGNDIMRRRGVYLEEPIVVAGQSYYVHAIGNRLHDTLSPDRWYLYHDVNYLLTVGSNRLQRLGATQKEDIGTGIPWKPKREYLKDIDERSEVYLREHTPVFEEHWTRTRMALETMRQFLAERRIRMMLILIPAQEQVDEHLRGELMAALGTDPARYDFEKPQRVLTQWGLQHGVMVVDLLPGFQQPDPAGFYFQNDMHWNVAGHALAATNILPILKSAFMQ